MPGCRGAGSRRAGADAMGGRAAMRPQPSSQRVQDGCPRLEGNPQGRDEPGLTCAIGTDMRLGARLPG